MNITGKAKNIIDNCRFCWMCRHVCPIGNATGHERNTARARAFAISMVERGATDLSEVVDNVYECTLCGACTNNCVTGFDPKVFIQETKTEIVLSGLAPEYVLSLVQNCMASGNVWGAEMPDALKSLLSDEGDVLFLAGSDAIVKAPECVATALTLLREAREKIAFTEEQTTGSALGFLTGKTAETLAAAQAFARKANAYGTVVVYDPADLAFLSHEYKEWGIALDAKVVSFQQYLLSLLKEGKIKVTRSEKEYTLQDNALLARDLDDVESGRELIAFVGKSRDMLLHGKETNLAGHLIMAEYMPDVIRQVARDRWFNAANMNCKTLVTESPAEYVALKETAPDGYRVVSVEEMIAENM
ncbi:MAG: (Fe-S)-binding protein [Clostridia bacterium]|nr:(Fe-S)-binding protein [Clostridia bacterium]